MGTTRWRNESVVLMLVIVGLGAGCAPPQVEEATGASSTAALAPGVFPDTTAGHDAARLYFTRYVHNDIEPQLTKLGVSDFLISRVAWFGLSEGIFTIGTNPEYGDPKGAQTPLTMSDCGDSVAINEKTAFPDCFGADGFAFESGNWEVGIGGVQVSDYLDVLPHVYAELYGTKAPSAIGQPILNAIGAGVTFPDLTIAEISTRANARWASVILRDPAINVYIETYDTWITDGRDLGYGLDIVQEVWAE
jgi:hypothetical protein